MKRDTIEKLDLIVAERKVTIELLLSCLANLEPRISKEAYKRAKFKNSGLLSNECYDMQMKILMKYRTLITSILLNHYSKDDITDMVKAVRKDDVVSNRLCDVVIELVESNDYSLIL